MQLACQGFERGLAEAEGIVHFEDLGNEVCLLDGLAFAFARAGEQREDEIVVDFGVLQFLHERFDHVRLQQQHRLHPLDESPEPRAGKSLAGHLVQNLLNLLAVASDALPQNVEPSLALYDGLDVAEEAREQVLAVAGELALGFDLGHARAVLLRERRVPLAAAEMRLGAATLQVERIILIDALEVFLLLAAKPAHDVQNLVLIDLRPQLHPLADIDDAAALVHVCAGAQLAEVALDELLELMPLQLQLALQQAHQVDCL